MEFTKNCTIMWIYFL